MRWTVGLTVALLGMAACSSGGSTAATTTSQPGHAASSPATTRPSSPPQDVASALFAHGWPAASGGACGSDDPGQGGVLMTFCHGPATATVTLPDGPHVLRGVCWFNGTTLELDAGVTVGRTFPGAWPDYITMQLPSSAGSVGSTFVAFIGGHEHLVQTADGTMTGTGLASGAAITPARLATDHLVVDVSGYALEDSTNETLHVTCG